MTGQPEAALARELELCFATVALVTDLDAGVAAGEGVRAEEVFAEFEKNIEPFKDLIRSAIDSAPTSDCSHCRVHQGVDLPFELP